MANNGTATQVATEKKLYRIGEVSRLADLKPFVLRYWETEFPMLQPVKSSSGHRLYRQEDVDMVFRIKRLLYDEGFTIAGARRFLREHDFQARRLSIFQHRDINSDYAGYREQFFVVGAQDIVNVASRSS